VELPGRSSTSWSRTASAADSRFKTVLEVEPEVRNRVPRPKFVDIVTLNSSGVPQLEAAMNLFGNEPTWKKLREQEHAESGEALERPVAVAAILGQEHHAKKLAFADFQHRSKKCGWKLHGAPAAKGDGGGDSAGVCIAANAQFELGAATGLAHDLSPKGSEGRLAAAWVGGVLRGGIMLMTIYLWHTEGLSARNVELLEAAGAAIAQYGGPWVLAGDFNMPPAELRLAQEWLKKIGGVVVAPDSITCKSASGGRTIDYFVVDSRITGAVERCWVDLCFPASPHSLVRLRMRSNATRDLARHLVKPTAFPKVRPVGCARQPVLPDREILCDLAAASVRNPEAVNKAFRHLFDLAEVELCGICDTVRSNGAPDKKFLGRGGELTTKWGPVVPRSAGMCGRSDAIVLGLNWIAIRLNELACLAVVVNKRGTNASREQQWHGITQKLRQPSGVLRQLLVFEKSQGRDDWKWKVAGAGHLTSDSLFAAASLRLWAKEAKAASSARSIGAAKVATKTWWIWVDSQLKSGAGGLHHVSKRADLAVEQPVGAVEGPSLGLQQVIDADLETWSLIWRRFETSASAPWRDLSEGWEEELSWAAPLPAITGEQIVEASKLFKANTGLGSDYFCPVWVAWLSRPLLDAFAELFMNLERLGFWPQQVQQILIALIPKADGGRRPIGLLPTLIRIWEKVRRPIMATWRCSVERSYNWAARGRSPQAAVWKVALQDEAALTRGERSAAGLVDLAKAFEQVQLELVWRCGLRLHLPPRILRLILETFAFARRLVLSGAVSEAVNTLSAILAGGGYATDALFVVLVQPCDELILEHPSASLCFFIDDLTVHVTGAEAEVAGLLHNALTGCISKLEDDLEFKVSRAAPGRCDKKAKTVGVASIASLTKVMAPKLKTLGVSMQRRVKFLGVDYAAGKPVVRAVQALRIKTICARAPGYRRLGKRAARHLVRTGAAPAMRYGVAVVGATNSALQTARRFSCAAAGEMRGRSAFARLQLAAYDVGALMAIDPLVEWAKAVWDGLVPREDLRIAWRRAVVEVGTANNPFLAVRGPAGAMVASVMRLGWKSTSPFDVIDASGVRLCFDVTCPAVVALCAKDDLMRIEAASSTFAMRIGGPPDLEPLGDLLASKAVQDRAVAESLRALGEDGWWPQSRMHSVGMPGVMDSTCRACLRAVGDLPHRCIGCSASSATRDAYEHQAVLDRARSHVHSREPLYLFGVPILPPRNKVPTFVSRWCGGRVPDGNFSFTGNGFTDGAMRGRAPKTARRAGWAAVLVDDDGLMDAGLYGTCGDRFPTAHRAELRGVVEILRHALPPLTIWTDCQGVVDGWLSGPTWCCSSARAAADLWRELWWIVDDIGGTSGIQVRKCKGHATDEDVASGKSSIFLRAGNDHADYFAGRGVDIEDEEVPSQVQRQSYLVAKRWYLWLARLTAEGLPVDTQPRYAVEEKPLRVPVALRPFVLHPTQPHTFVEGVAKWECAICLRHTAIVAGRLAKQRLAHTACEGSASTRATAAAGCIDVGSFGRGHNLYASGKLVWCFVCGSYGQTQLKELRTPCNGPAVGTRKYILSRLKRGLHPAAKTPLERAVKLTP
jgi:ribonuclease HI